MDEDNNNENNENLTELENKKQEIDDRELSNGNPIRNFIKNPISGFGKILENALKNKPKKISFLAKVAGLSLGLKVALIGGAVFIILIVIIIIVRGDDSTRNVVKNKQASFESLNLNSENASNMDKLAYELYNTYDSYLAFNTSQLKTMYDNFKKMNDNKFAKYIVDAGKDSFGSMNAENTSIEHSRSLYEHILRTEKYNFNSINWRRYTHNEDNVKMNTVVDEGLELKIPAKEESDKINPDGPDEAEDEETVITLMKTTSPYILTNDIPLGMLNGLVSSSNSNSDTLQSRGQKFVYQLLKEALSRITVNKYILESVKFQTRAKILQKATVSETVTFVGHAVPDENGNTHIETERRTEKHIVSVHSEELLEENPTTDRSYSYDTYWYVSKARVYDADIVNNFDYTKYINEDVDNIVNPDVAILIGSEYHYSPETAIADYAASYDGEVHSETREYEADITIYNDYEKEWKDKLKPTNVDYNKYKLEDIEKYNTSDDTDFSDIMPSDRKNISFDDEKGESNKELLKSYEDEDKSNRLYGLSLIDFMESNSNIYRKYLSKNSEYGIYIGLGRHRLLEGYKQTKNMINSLLTREAEDGESGIKIDFNFNSSTSGIAVNKAVPFVYGSSLGYDVTMPGANISSAVPFVSSFELLKEYLRALEGIGSKSDSDSTKIVEQDGKKYYRVADNGIVGYGVDLNANPQWKTDLEGLIGGSITFGETLIECELVDAIEDQSLNEQLEKVKSLYPDLKEYQQHALVARGHDVDDLDEFGSHYNSEYNESTDDKYESVYEQYKDNQTATSQIVQNADKDSVLYINYLSKSTGADESSDANYLASRRFSEWCLFSLGYYDKLQKFWTAGGGTSPVGELVDANGNIIMDKVYELQLWYEDNIFCGLFHAPPGQDYKIDDCKWYSAKTEAVAKQVFPSQRGIVGGQFYDYSHTVEQYKAVSSNTLGIFQCTWWSVCQQARYLTENGYSGQIKNDTRDGSTTAESQAKAYNRPDLLNRDINQVKAHSVASEGGSDIGHTYFIEAVGKDSDGDMCMVISHCGSGHVWHGVDVIKLKQGYVFHSPFNASFCYDDLLQ